MLFERPAAGSRALILHVETGETPLSTRSEFTELSQTAGLLPVVEAVARRRTPDPRTFIGSGKLEDVKYLVDEAECQIVLVDQDLSPAQERNIESTLGIAVRGRTGLILDIFAQRARTHEGKLQVELAQLQHESARLVRGWTHLDRQRGGSGAGAGGGRGGGGATAGLGGAGETQLEADQRILGQQIKQVSRRLEKVRKGRELNRRGRSKAGVPAVSLVGYTNAGKSTAFNRLCGADVYAQDQLFATLDPTLRRLELAGMGEVVVSDTVGFIRKLPHTLIDAFRATLEEVCEADLLVHVVDAASADRAEQMLDVFEVLREIGAAKVPCLTVYNKIDLLDEAPRIARDAHGLPDRVWVSAVTGEGFDLLREAIAERLSGSMVERVLNLGPHEGRLRAALYEMGAVTDERFAENGGSEAHLRCDAARLEHVLSRYSA
ncbi:MAG: GTPase HflX [Gammaproteobacteria bacterium]|nr:GTPase HflX [Gammaproteobacteria bacterium]